MKKTLIFVLTDSISNSVFYGQVLAPIIKKLQQELYQQACIISFEQKQQAPTTLKDITNMHPKISVFIIPRTPFIHHLFLRSSIRQLQAILDRFDQYNIIARGALSGLLALKAINSTKCGHLTIQARGLLAEEYWYEHARSTLLRPVHSLRTWCYHELERAAYAPQQSPTPYTIEPVSTALGEYLIKNFGTSATHLHLAHEDVPARIAQNHVETWRKETRKKLAIPEDVTVYCFSGALKSWQNPTPIIEYFIGQHRKNTKSFLLILSQDADKFTQFLQRSIPAQSYYVAHISHAHMYNYLAAADKGLIFR